MFRSAPLFLAIFLAVPALSADIELRYAALERLIAEQLFTQDGRRYVRGTPSTPCQFAYLEAPRLSSPAGADGRLKSSARQAGRWRAPALGANGSGLYCRV